MKDLEKRLGGGSIKPRRPLDNNFTSKVIARLGEGRGRPKPRPKWKEYLPMKLLHKPIIATFAVVTTIAVGGSAYAAVGGLGGVRALFGGQQPLQDGARIVKVETENCPHVDAFNVTQKKRNANSTYYYKLKANSKLSNKQVVHMVQGYCEADAEAALNETLIRKVASRPENQNKLAGGYVDSVITAISDSKLSLRAVIPIGHKNQVVDQVFTRIDPHVVVINKGVKEAFDTLKVGDHVSVGYRATGDALKQSETIRPDQIDYSAQTVVIITRLSERMSEYYDYQKYNSKEFEQVTPCESDPSGYCTLDQLNRR